jgi:hypothetical protein
MLTIRVTTFKENISVFDICNPESDMEDVWYKLKTSLLDTANLKRHCWIQPKRCMRLPNTINGKRRLGGGRKRLMKPSSRNPHAYKALDNESKSNEVE